MNKTLKKAKKKYKFKQAVINLKKFLIICGISIIAFFGLIIFLYFSSEKFATELRQLRQPRPNFFNIGMDVSQTINPDTLSDIKRALIFRLHDFIGDNAVSYRISVFGTAGCGTDALERKLSVKSPATEVEFKRSVERKINNIALAGKEYYYKPLAMTTPFYDFLKRTLKETAGQRVIIFSDLVNDDEECNVQHPFPLDELVAFGENKGSEIIIFYPYPFIRGQYDSSETKDELYQKQTSFIKKMEKLNSQDKIRVTFYHIPMDPKKRVKFLRSRLKSTVPSTVFDLVFERTGKLLKSIVVAVRG